MEQLMKKIKKNKKLWLTSGVALLLVVVLVVSQLMVHYVINKKIVSMADNENQQDLEQYQFTEGYEQLVEYDCPMDENVVATMTYTTLVTLKEETEETSSVSNNNTPEQEDPTEEETDGSESDELEENNGSEGEESGSDEIEGGLSGTDDGTDSDASGSENSSDTPSNSEDNGGTPSGSAPPSGDTPSDVTPSGEESPQNQPTGNDEQQNSQQGADESAAIIEQKNIMFLADVGGALQPEPTTPSGQDDEDSQDPGAGSGTGDGTGAGADSGTGDGTGAGADSGTGDGTGAGDGSGTDNGTEDGDESEDETETETEPEEDQWPKEIEVTLHFTDLNSAFLAAQALYELKQEELADTEEIFIPCIVMVKDVTLGESLVTSNPYTFELDLNGHLISFSENTYWNVISQGTIILTDNIEAGEYGGLYTNNEYLFDGQARLVFEKGYYLAGNGSVIKNATAVTVHDGVFAFDRQKKFFQEGVAELPVGKVFYPQKITFRNEEITCQILDDPDYMVVFNEETSYFATFIEAWEEAQELSVEHGNELARISVFDDQIVRILVDEPLVQTKGFLEIDNQCFIRGDEYRDSFFVIDGGDLTLFGVSLDGTTYSEEIFVANDPLVKIHAGNVHLLGTEEHPFVMENNIVSHVRISAYDVTPMGEEENGEPEEGKPEEEVPIESETAGIFVGNQGRLTLCGTLMIKDNWIVTEITEDNPKGLEHKNITLSPYAQLIIAGKLTEDSRIGISYTKEVVPGLTILGKIGEEYLEAFVEEGLSLDEASGENGAQGDNSSGTDEEDVLKGDERLKIFSLDAPEYRAYYAMYNENDNEVFWDKDQIMLPEAGVFKIETILFMAAVYLMILMVLIMFIKKEPISKPILVASLSCLAFSLIFGTYRIVHERNLARKNQEVMDEIIALYDHPQEIQLSQGLQAAENIENMHADNDKPKETVSSKKEPSVPQDGREYIGIIEIEELKIKLPVLAEYSGTNMKTTPCVYYGEIGEPNLVIVGHNYDSQFGTLNTIGEDEVIHVRLTLLDGTIYEYVSAKKEELNPSDVDKMLSSAWDLTIFTCNYVGDKRITFRCELIN